MTREELFELWVNLGVFRLVNGGNTLKFGIFTLNLRCDRPEEFLRLYHGYMAYDFMHSMFAVVRRRSLRDIVQVYAGRYNVSPSVIAFTMALTDTGYDIEFGSGYGVPMYCRRTKMVGKAISIRRLVQ